MNNQKEFYENSKTLYMKNIKKAAYPAPYMYAIRVFEELINKEGKK